MNGANNTVMPQLVLPSDQYKLSFLQAVREYQDEGLPYYTSLDSTQLEADFSTYIAHLTIEQPPHTTLWLVEGSEFLGRVDIRQSGDMSYDVRPTQRRKGYGKLALDLGLQEAAKMGIKDALVTCEVGNIGSTKIIEAEGGILEKITPQATGKPDQALYRISLQH